MAKLNEKERATLKRVFKVLRFKHPSIWNFLNDPKIGREIYGAFEAGVDYELTDNGRLIFRIPFHSLGFDVEMSEPFREGMPHTEVEPVEQVTQKPVVVSVPKGRGKAAKPAKKVTSIALDDDLIQALNERAEREERTVSALIRLAIKHYLECVK